MGSIQVLGTPHTVVAVYDTGTEVTASAPEDFAALIRHQIARVVCILESSGREITQ